MPVRLSDDHFVLCYLKGLCRGILSSFFFLTIDKITLKLKKT